MIVTSWKLDVANLSAISADLGTVTAGTIASGTIEITSGELTAGGGNVILNSSGLTLVSGGAATNALSWSSGTLIKDVAGILSVQAGAIALETGSVGVTIDPSNSAWFPHIGSVSLGTSGNPWSDLYLSGAGSVASVLSDFESRISALENP